VQREERGLGAGGEVEAVPLVEDDGLGVVAGLAQRGERGPAGDERDLALGGSAAHQDGDMVEMVLHGGIHSSRAPPVRQTAAAG